MLSVFCGQARVIAKGLLSPNFRFAFDSKEELMENPQIFPSLSVRKKEHKLTQRDRERGEKCSSGWIFEIGAASQHHPICSQYQIRSCAPIMGVLIPFLPLSP